MGTDGGLGEEKGFALLKKCGFDAVDYSFFWLNPAKSILDDGYLERESDSIKRLQKLELWKIPADFDYNTIPGLRNESRAKLIKAAPSTLAQAARLDGVTPSEIGLLQIHLTRQKHQQKESQAE